jgi:predicted RNA-binding Zn-ribbon protein involved in translation (DUF1610 family)
VEIMPKPVIKCCGKELKQGSGYFSTDYKCPVCGSEYNSAGNKLTDRSEWGEETDEQFG